MRYQKSRLRKWFGPAGLADYIFPLLAEYFRADTKKEQKQPIKQKKESIPLASRLRKTISAKEIGERIARNLKKIKAVVFPKAAKIAKKIGSTVRRFPKDLWKTIRTFFQSFPNRAVYRFEQLQTWKYRRNVRLRAAKPEILTALKEKGIRVLLVFSGSMLALAVTVVFSLGYCVTVNGEEIGVIRAPEELEIMRESIQHDFEDLEMDQAISLSITFVRKNQMLDQSALRKAFLETYDSTVDGAVILVAGETRAALLSESEAYEVLKIMQEKYGEEGAKVTFEQPVEVVTKSVPLSLAVGVESAVELLEGKQSRDGYYTVRQGDTFWSIANAYGMDVDTLMSINQSGSEKIVVGDELLVQIPEPYLSVCSTRTITYTEEIPYTTRQIEDDSMYRGKSAVVTAGVPGEKEIEATVVKINGLETSRTILNETVLSEPTERVVKIGTKTPPRTLATGSFGRPTSGSLTSRFGTRWGRSHTGIDIGASTGTPVYAADGGVVTLSGWNGGYGKMIAINHENGYVTYYAHCSSLLVSSGKRVAKGDLIAYVGSTGRSTGPHLHFEVRKNGTPQNPLNYVSY